MPFFTSKKTDIEAVQWTGDNTREVQRFVGKMDTVEEVEGFTTHAAYTGKATLFIAANSAWGVIDQGEWVAKDSEGFYPIKDNIFRKKYEPKSESKTERVIVGEGELSGSELLAYMGTDAMKWADQFCARVNEYNLTIDEGLLVGWFANAIEQSKLLTHVPTYPFPSGDILVLGPEVFIDVAEEVVIGYKGQNFYRLDALGEVPIPMDRQTGTVDRKHLARIVEAMDPITTFAEHIEHAREGDGTVQVHGVLTELNPAEEVVEADKKLADKIVRDISPIMIDMTEQELSAVIYDILSQTQRAQMLPAASRDGEGIIDPEEDEDKRNVRLSVVYDCTKCDRKDIVLGEEAHICGSDAPNTADLSLGYQHTEPEVHTVPEPAKVATPVKNEHVPVGYKNTTEQKFRVCRHCGKVIYRWLQTPKTPWFHVSTNGMNCSK